MWIVRRLLYKCFGHISGYIFITPEHECAVQSSPAREQDRQRLRSDLHLQENSGMLIINYTMNQECPNLLLDSMNKY